MKHIVLAAALAAATAGSASAATYEIDWTGAGAYTLEGVLTFADALLGTGVINETQITNLSIEVFLSGVSQGARDLLADGLGSFAGTFNLNFDTIAEQFVVGGQSDTDTGQQWFTDFYGNCDTVGFISGDLAQGVCAGGNPQVASVLPTGSSTLTATRVDATPVPLPASLPLVLAGLAALGLMARRKAA